MGQALASVFYYSAPHRARDTVGFKELSLSLPVSNDGADASSAGPQVVLISLTIPHDISRTARSDDLTHSIDYAAIYNTLTANLPKANYASLEALLDRVFDTIFGSHPQVGEATVVVALRDTTPRFAVGATRRQDQMPSIEPVRFTISALAFSTIVGVNPPERIKKQPVVLDIIVERTQGSNPHQLFPFFRLSTSLSQMFTVSDYLTVESLASAAARHVLEFTNIPGDRVAVELSKPEALSLAAAAQVRVTGRLSDFADVALPGIRPSKHIESKPAGSSSHLVALALGSNLGDRFANIESALRLLEIPTSLLSHLPQDAEVSVVDTSFMYETAPMYVTDQPWFVNCACMIETNLLPVDLLHLVKAIEGAVGRVPSKRYGPRAIDLDILTYDDQLVDSRPLDDRATLDNLIGELVIPHPRLCEREFVLRPLNDMIPDFVHPLRHKTIRTLLDEVTSSTRSGDMFKVMPFPKYPTNSTELVNIHGVQVPQTATHWIVSPTYSTQNGRPNKTHLMAILNVTPDSFSDGAQHDTVPTALVHATAAIAAGADIIDIGGHSTRPSSVPVQTEEELWRVIPVIEAIRAHPEEKVRNALVSVDTFRWEVAEEAIRAGANCINDVYAFSGPTYPEGDGSQKHLAKMRSVARQLGVPVVLMHSRGEAGRNKDYDDYSGLIPAIQTELGRKVDAIVRGPGGVRRWLIFVDPGIGFSKPVSGQLALMRDLSQLTAVEAGNMLAGYPVLFGASKKSMLGAVLEEGDVGGAYAGRKTTAGERGWATAAAVACAVQQGASVVRVHDVAEMRDVVAIASAIWSR